MKVLCPLGLLLFSGFVFAHSSGTDAQGCHTNRKTGDYHCHGAKAASAAATPQRNALPVSPQRGEPICHVGPRGGTYTITKSGRKNYSGC